jgi:putative iron-dependent peroxidase
MSAPQPTILAPLPQSARSLVFDLRGDGDPREGLRALLASFDPEHTTLGLGEPLVRALGAFIAGLRSFPTLEGSRVTPPSTQGALWLNLRGGDRGELGDRARAARELLGSAFVLADDTECFVYRGGRDLTGYEDGTENPTDEAAVEAALSRAEGIEGSSFVAVQRWVHDLASFRARSQVERDDTFGRRQQDNEEFEEAPPSAHVKRAAQESFEPAAFMLRRSMPFLTQSEAGLLFIAFGESLDRYERVLRRMVGLDDGVVDALFGFSRPVTGGYYWCPPLEGEALDTRWLPR